MKRDANIELYRCLLTFGIVILHVIGFYGKEWHWLSSMFVWCVPGFVFITGYFGIKFSVAKILRLYGICMWCFPVSIAVGQSGTGGGVVDILRTAWTAFLGNWFVHAYVGLMMLAPVIDAALEPLKKSKHIRDMVPVFAPFLFFVFVWSFLSNYNCVSQFVAKAPSCEVLTLLGIYTIARVFRICEFESKVSLQLAIVLFAVGVGLATLRIGKFNSLLSIAITIGGFVWCRRIRLNEFCKKVVLFSAPSMFSIFLIHANSWCLNSMHRYVDVVAGYGVPKIMSFFIVAVVVFVSGLLLDIPRRFVVWCTMHKFHK